MNKTIFYNFLVNKEKNEIKVERSFNAPIDLVWDAWTDPEIIDQWWAPKPWYSKTKCMNFEVGGRRLYAMCSPEGQEHWSIQDYIKISPKTNFKFISAFVDKDENINTKFASSEWNLIFSETNGVTTVRITIKHKSLADLEQNIIMGFKEGFTKTLNYLEKILTK